MEQDQRLVNLARLSYLALLLGTFVWKTELDHFVVLLWEELKTNRYFKHDSCEPVIASISFAAWIWLFYVIDKTGILFKYKIVKKYDESSWNTNSPRALFFYLAPLLFIDYYFPRRKLPERAPSFHGLLGTLCNIHGQSYPACISVSK